jgi:hypothetical protein
MVSPKRHKRNHVRLTGGKGSQTRYDGRENQPDELDEILAKRPKTNPELTPLVAARTRRRIVQLSLRSDVSLSG